MLGCMDMVFTVGRNVMKDGARYIWDDYNIIVENAEAENVTYNTWGLDLDGTMQGLGGVGGLLDHRNQWERRRNGVQDASRAFLRESHHKYIGE